MFSRDVARIALGIILCALSLSRIAAESEPRPAGRVFIAEHAGATEAFSAQAAPTERLVREGLVRFTGKSSVKDAWHSLVSTQDVVGIKVHSAPGPMSGTRPAVVSALIETLLESGFAPAQIVIWDKQAVDLRLAGFFKMAERYGIRVEGSLEAGYDAAALYTTPLLGKLVYGDLEFGQKGEGIGRSSHVTKLLTRRITKIVSVTPLLNHNQAGVSGAMFGLAMASVDNTLRFEDSNRLATAIPEIYALPEIGDKVILNVVDALICQFRGEERSLLHYSTPLNQVWFSHDPVALDILAVRELDRNRREGKTQKSTLQIYANAALMDLGIAETNRIKIERLELR